MIEQIIEKLIPFVANREAGFFYYIFFIQQNTKLLYRLLIKPNLNIIFNDFLED